MSRLRVVTVKMEEELLERVDELARELGVSRSAVIRSALELYLKLNSDKLRPRVIYVKLNS